MTLQTTTTEILLVEDSPTQAAALAALLIHQGYAVRMATNGREALAILAQDRPALVISDIAMPDMDGYTLCRAIKWDTALAQVPVILMTSQEDSQRASKGRGCGADSFVAKPYDPQCLLSSIRLALLRAASRRDPTP
ncbi:MAG TPA: response regulator [Chloroflexia bacterium]|nr:response regulator [Chloroflexia bacterium]